MLVVALAASSPAWAKRAAPAEVAPVVHDGVRYEAPHWANASPCRQNGGCVVATDATTGEARWHTVVYSVVPTPGLETDVQDVFITALTVSDGKLQVEDERGRRFTIDLATRSVTERKRACAVAGPELAGVGVALLGWRQRRGRERSATKSALDVASK